MAAVDSLFGQLEKERIRTNDLPSPTRTARAVAAAAAAVTVVAATRV